MDKIVNFSGLAFEVGQMKRGLRTSPERAFDYVSILENAGLSVIDCGTISDGDSFASAKIFSDLDLELIEWDNYQKAYHKSVSLLQKNQPLINWGGDHSVAISTVGAFNYCFPNGHVIWIDAHADLNLPNQSMTGNFHGMPLSVLLNLEGIGSKYFKWIDQELLPSQIIYLGLRDLDPFESSVISSLGIKAFTYKDIQLLGIECITREIVSLVKDSPVHISFDVDSIDPRYAPSTGVPVQKGLTPDDLLVLGQAFYKHMNVQSVDVVEINPLIGNSLEVDQTYITAFQFLKNIFTNQNLGDSDESMGTRIQRERLDEMEWCL